MAVAYADVFKALKLNFTVIGRGEASADNFEAATGIRPVTGGLEQYIANTAIPQDTYAVVATGTEALMNVLRLLVNSGITNILVEKPAAISISELLENEDLLNPFSTQIYIAYNRRFYASVIEAKKLIEEDGGLQTMFFEFTEWAHKIEPLVKAPGVKENWFFANSTHVVDLAFHLAGKPADWSAYSKTGTLKWHTKTNFSGAGITENNVLFSYMSNWESSGRWGIELLTKNRRIYLKPLEGISITPKGVITTTEHTFNVTEDEKFKPGLFLQTKAFISGNSENLISLKEHIYNSREIYLKILGDVPGVSTE